MSKIWKLKPSFPQDFLADSGYSPLVKQLLYNRGIFAPAAESFLNPRYENLFSPFLFADMEKAVQRIFQAMENEENICIYGDYDADAVTANAVLRQAFNFLNYDKVSSYIPDRFSEGYGVNLEALEKIRGSMGATLVITVDCGTNSADAAEFCASHGMDLIITDHHEIIGQPPRAYALINPKNSADNYPNTDLVGVGVAFKLACALLQDPRAAARSPRLKPGAEKWLLDLVAVGTVADCHALVGENRILVKYGLKVLAKTRWPGLRALLQASGRVESRELDSYALGFVIAPRLNAAGRLEHADIALDLLLSQDLAAAQAKAARLEQINARRQQLTASVVSEAKEQVIKIQNRKILAVLGDNWPKGVVGLVAGRLAEEFYKPVIVLERTEEFCTGSARSVGGFDILAAIKHASAHTEKFGGHKQAAGLTVRFSEFENFYAKLLEFAETRIQTEAMERVLELEAELDESQLSIVTCHLLSQFEPFGVGNPSPKFLARQMTIAAARLVGVEGRHTQYQLRKNGQIFSAIAFNSAAFEKRFKIGDTVDVACELMEDGWNGRVEVKLKIVDLKIHNAI